VINIKDQPSQYLAEIDRIEIVESAPNNRRHHETPRSADADRAVRPTNGILERRGVVGHTGHRSRQRRTEDKATNWLNQNSAGAGPYTMVNWTRNAQIP